MKIMGDVVIGADGFVSLWIDRAKAMLYAARVHGVVEGLVTEWEAKQEAKEAYQRGLEQGRLLCQPDQPADE